MSVPKGHRERTSAPNGRKKMSVPNVHGKKDVREHKGLLSCRPGNRRDDSESLEEAISVVFLDVNDAHSAGAKGGALPIARNPGRNLGDRGQATKNSAIWSVRLADIWHHLASPSEKLMLYHHKRLILQMDGRLACVARVRPPRTARRAIANASVRSPAD